MEALAKQDNEINEDYDFWNAAPKLKTPYLKFCNAYNNRLHNVLAEYRIICEDETQTTTASVKGMILNWKSRTPMSRQQQSEMTLELQFLEIHRREYVELSTDFASMSFLPKSREALENMKALVLLDLRILLGADIPWSHSGKQPELAAAALSQGGAGDDDSVSSKDNTPAPAEGAAAPGAAAPKAAALDPNDFLTWTHKNWDKVPFDHIKFPSGQTPLKTKAYYAVAVIFLNTVSLREQHATVWKELTDAWEETFGYPLTIERLGDPPATGTNAFTEEERAWCEETRRYFSANGRGRAASPPPGEQGRRGQRTHVRRKVVVEHPAGGSPATPVALRKTATAAPKTPTNSGSVIICHSYTRARPRALTHAHTHTNARLRARTDTRTSYFDFFDYLMYLKQF